MDPGETCVVALNCPLFSDLRDGITFADTISSQAEQPQWCVHGQFSSSTLNVAALFFSFPGRILNLCTRTIAIIGPMSEPISMMTTARAEQDTRRRLDHWHQHDDVRHWSFMADKIFMDQLRQGCGPRGRSARRSGT